MITSRLFFASTRIAGGPRMAILAFRVLGRFRLVAGLGNFLGQGGRRDRFRDSGVDRVPQFHFFPNHLLPLFDRIVRFVDRVVAQLRNRTFNFARVVPAENTRSLFASTLDLFDLTAKEHSQEVRLNTCNLSFKPRMLRSNGSD